MKILEFNPKMAAELSVAAAQDNHRVIEPTHVLINSRQEFRGYLSVSKVQCVMFWSHTQNNAFESLRLVNAGKKMVRESGGFHIWPCTEKSPFFPLMDKMGFDLIGNSNFFNLR